MNIEAQLASIRIRLEQIEELTRLQNERGANDIRRRLIAQNLNDIDVRLIQIRERNYS